MSTRLVFAGELPPTVTCGLLTSYIQQLQY